MSAESTLARRPSSEGRPPHVRARVHRSNDGNISVGSWPDRLLMTPEERLQGLHDADMMCITDLEGGSCRAIAIPSSEMLMHLEVYRQRPDVQAVVTPIRRSRPGLRSPAFRSIAPSWPKC
jgi:hypothetical protein